MKHMDLKHSTASKTEQVEDSLAANRYPGGDKGGNCFLFSNEESCSPSFWQHFQLSWGQIFGEPCFFLRLLKIGEMSLTREPLTSFGFSFWTELNDSIWGLMLVRISFEGRLGWEEAL